MDGWREADSAEAEGVTFFFWDAFVSADGVSMSIVDSVMVEVYDFDL